MAACATGSPSDSGDRVSLPAGRRFDRDFPCARSVALDQSPAVSSWYQLIVMRIMQWPSRRCQTFARSIIFVIVGAPPFSNADVRVRFSSTRVSHGFSSHAACSGYERFIAMRMRGPVMTGNPREEGTPGFRDIEAGRGQREGGREHRISATN